jgi:hypothetical protein
LETPYFSKFIDHLVENKLLVHKSCKLCQIKVGIILKKLEILVVLIIVSLDLFSFEPKISDFSSQYQFKMYESWLEKADLKTNYPAGFTKNKIVKSFSKDGKMIFVEYDLKNRKIENQRESLPFALLLQSDFKVQNYIEYLESFIYRLNTDKIEYLMDFVDLKEVKIGYSAYENKTALKVLFRDFINQRVEVEPIEFLSIEDGIGFSIQTQKKVITIVFPADLDVAKLLEEKRTKFSRKIPKKDEAKEEKITIVQPSNITVEIPKKSLKTGTLLSYIDVNFAKPPSRELLNNKVKNVRKFLTDEFPNHEISFVADKFYLKSKKSADGLYADMKLEVVFGKDGVDIYASTDHEIRENKLILNRRETIDLSKLSPTEIAAISTQIPSLIYEHRSLSSKLLNFLLVHDNVASTLVIYGEEREVYEMESYANLLLLLHNFWKNGEIYFSITDILRKNGNIEFEAILTCQNGAEKDVAEVKFHLDKDYKIDLIMMILHPEKK